MALFLPVLLFAPFSYATVLNNTIVHEYALSSSCPSRSLSKIITSCVTTLFACAWTAIHPNVPGPGEGSIAVWFRRLVIMILAFAVPEFVVMWAIRQFFAARRTQKQFQGALRDRTLELRVKPYCEPRLVSGKVPRDVDEVDIPIPEETTESWSEKLKSLRPSSHVHEKLCPGSLSVDYHWTLKHSFYAWMGGFMLYIPASPREIYYPLTPDELLEFLKADHVQMTMMSKRDLDDRDKGDWVSKTLAVIQLAWFVVQLVARGFVQLPTTQLEIGTLAVAVLSCFTYGFWWHKPKNVRCPVPVYWKGPGNPPDRTTYSAPQSISEFMSQFGVKKNRFVDSWYEISQPMLNLQGVHCVSNAAVKTRRVPSLCGYPPDKGKETFGRNFPIIIVGYLCGIAFGVIHCIAWDFTFPTYTEKVLWRVSTVAIIAIPGLLMLMFACAFRAASGDVIPYPAVTLASIAAIGHLWTIVCVIKAVLLVITLRSLPAGVYDEVCWSVLIPHWY